MSELHVTCFGCGKIISRFTGFLHCRKCTFKEPEGSTPDSSLNEAIKMLLPALASAVSPSKEHDTFRKLALQKGYEAVSGAREHATPDSVAANTESFIAALKESDPGSYVEPAQGYSDGWFVIDGTFDIAAALTTMLSSEIFVMAAEGVDDSPADEAPVSRTQVLTGPQPPEEIECQIAKKLLAALDSKRDYRLSPDKHYIGIDEAIAIVREHLVGSDNMVKASEFPVIMHRRGCLMNPCSCDQFMEDGCPDKLRSGSSGSASSANYGSGAVESAAERHYVPASAEIGFYPAQEGDALIPESAPATKALDAAALAYCKATGLNPEHHLDTVREPIRQAIEAYASASADSSEPQLESAEQPDDCRAAFEKWYRDEYVDVGMPWGMLKRDGDLYSRTHAQSAWEGWKAAWCPERESVECYVQHKGSNLCIDLSCACGWSTHYDGDFCYGYKCPECGTAYRLADTMQAVPVKEWPEGVAEPRGSENRKKSSDE